MVTIDPNHVDLDLHCPIGWSNSQTHILHIKLHLHLSTVQLLSYHVIQLDMIYIYVMEPQAWGGPKATEHTKMPPHEEAGLAIKLLHIFPRTNQRWRCMGYTVQPRLSKLKKLEMRQKQSYCNKRPLDLRGSLLPCELKRPCSRSATDCHSPKCPVQQIHQD